jgi:hypothetical protein
MTTEIRNDEVGVFLARELETILSRTFEVEYADIKYSQLIPISTEVGPGADSFTYRVFDKQGSMKVISDKTCPALTCSARKSPCRFAASAAPSPTPSRKPVPPPWCPA